MVAPLFLIVVWAVVVAPGAENPLPQTLRMLIGRGLLLAAVALAAAGQMRAAVVAAVIVLNTVLGSVARDAFATALLDHLLQVSEARSEGRFAGSWSDHDAFVGTYGDTRLSVTTVAKLMGLLSRFTVSRSNGVLVTTLAGFGEQRWAEVEPGVFADVAGPGRLAFTIGPDDRATHVAFSAFPETSFAATRWVDRFELHGALFVVWLAAAFSSFVAWPFFGRVRAGRDGAGTVWTRIVRRLPAATSVLSLVFVVILVVSLLDFAELELGVGPLLAAGLRLNLATAALSFASVLVAAWAWRRSAWSTLERLHYSFVALACVSLTWQLHHWNLLGVRV